MRKRIAFVLSGSLPVPATKGGAVESLVEYLIRENEKKKKYRFILAGPYEKEAEKAAENYKLTEFVFIRTLSIKRSMDMFISKVIAKLFKVEIPLSYINYAKAVRNRLKRLRGKLDYVVIENNVALVRVLSKLDVPILYHLHNDNLNLNTPSAEKILAECNGVMAVSEFIKQRVSTIEGGAAKTKVLLNSSDTELFEPQQYSESRREIRKEYNLSDGDTVLIYSGRLHPTKGVVELVEAFSRIEDGSIYLMIAGGSWYSSNREDAYVRRIRELAKKKEKNVIWLGYVKHEEMPKYYASADIAVFPSVWDEPSSLVVLEAGAAGLPIITTVSGGIPENTSDDAAILINKDDREKLKQRLRDEIVSLAGNKEKRERMSVEGLNFAKKRGIKDFYESFEKLICEWETENREERCR